jgi:hypothetical protein
MAGMRIELLVVAQCPHEAAAIDGKVIAMQQIATESA